MVSGYATVAASVVVGLLGFAVWWLFEANEEKAATIGVQAGEIAGLKSTLDAQRKQVKLSRTHAEAIAKLEAKNNERTAKLVAEINHWRLTADRNAVKKPFDFGNDADRRLADVMCRIAAGNNGEKRAACDLSAAETNPARIAYTVTVTRETVEYWDEQCDAGERDFCDWSITGFTPQGLGTHLTWLQMVDRYQLDQANWIDGARHLVDRITADK